MLDELLKEIDELKSYKSKYESALESKQKMSDLLYDYMMKEWKNMSREDRVDMHIDDICSCCRYRMYCTIELPEDILKPIPSDKAWIPARTCCKKFEWS